MPQLISKGFKDELWKPYTVRKNKSEISHLCFVDDMLFAKASEAQLERVLYFLKLFRGIASFEVV